VNPSSTQTAADAPAVVVTGSSTGLGRSTALALTAAGYRVFAGVRRSSDGEALLAAAAPHRGRGRLTPVIIEVTDAESIAAAAREVSAAVGPRGLGGLINNAGIGVFGPLEAVSIDDCAGSTRSMCSARSPRSRPSCRCCVPEAAGW